MAEIQWFPAGRVQRKDGPGFSWVGLTPRQFDQAYWRTFRGERYAQVDLTPGKRPMPDNVVELLHEMRDALPPEEGPDVPYDADV